jgi:hypothetical protein
MYYVFYKVIILHTVCAYDTLFPTKMFTIY